MNNLKVKEIVIETIKGTKKLLFAPIPYADEGCFCCDKYCPIGIKKCCLLPNPLDLDNEDSSFQNFCASLGEGDWEYGRNSELRYYVPVEGTIESNFHDLDDRYRKYIEENGYVNIKTVIRKCCQDCSMLTDDFRNCNATNELCLLGDLLKNINFKK